MWGTPLISPTTADGSPLIDVRFYYMDGASLGQCTTPLLANGVPSALKSTITCTAPVGVGGNYQVIVNVAGAKNSMANSMRCASASICTSGTATTPGSACLSLDTSCTGVSYSAPALTSVTTVATGGGMVYLIGTNLGPIASDKSRITVFFMAGGTASMACLGSTDTSKCVPCASARTLYDNGTQISCMAPAGYGGQYDIVAYLGPSIVPANIVKVVWANAVFYAAPIVTGVTSVGYFGGRSIVISGSNFGCSDRCGGLPFAAVAPQVFIGPDRLPCTSPNVSTPHSVITCTAPAYLDKATFANVPVAVKIGGLTSTKTYGDANPTYVGPKSAQSFYTFSFYIGPLITAVSPVSYLGGAVTITGTNFGYSGNANLVGNGAAIQPAAILINGAPIDIVASAATVLVSNGTTVRE